MAEITKKQTVAEISGLVTNTYNRIEATSSSASLQLTESNFSNAETVFVGGLALTLKEDGTYRVDGRGDVVSDSISIPSTYNGSPVTEIATQAFWNDSIIKHLEIPLSVTKIGNMAFYGCTNLQSIFFEDSDKLAIYFQAPDISDWENPCVVYQGADGENIKEFPGDAMTLVNPGNRIYFCEIPLDAYSLSFNTGEIGGQVASIYNISTSNPATCVFATTPSNTLPGAPVLIHYDLKYLEDYNPPLCGSTLSIGNSAFCSCTSLTMVNLPRRTGSMGTSAFDNCTALQRVWFQTKHRLSKIGINAFNGCRNLYGVTVEEGVKHIDNGAFSGCENLKTFNWVSTLRTIGADAFRNCIGLDDFTIPASVKTIGMNAFVWDDYAKSRYIAFEDPYTWFTSKDETVDPRNLELQHPTYIYDGKTGTQSSVTLYNGMRLSYTEVDNSAGNRGDYYWHKLKQMPAPEISISNGVLSMTDPLGQAERFYIYVNGKKKVTIEV